MKTMGNLWRLSSPCHATHGKEDVDSASGRLPKPGGAEGIIRPHNPPAIPRTTLPKTITRTLLTKASTALRHTMAWIRSKPRTLGSLDRSVDALVADSFMRFEFDYAPSEPLRPV
jgi:hypothetical protein